MVLDNGSFSFLGFTFLKLLLLCGGIIAIIPLSSVVTLSYAFIQSEKDKQASGFTKVAEEPFYLSINTQKSQRISVLNQLVGIVINRLNTSSTMTHEQANFWIARVQSLMRDIRDEMGTLDGVSISNPEFCTLSKMGGFTDFLMCLHKRIEEKRWEVGEVYRLARSFL